LGLTHDADGIAVYLGLDIDFGLGRDDEEKNADEGGRKPFHETSMFPFSRDIPNAYYTRNQACAIHFPAGAVYRTI
jgi:hypothetical protein